ASGKALAPAALPGEDEAAASISELAQILKDAGAELILLEMMYHPTRSRLALIAALGSGLAVWFGLSARRGADGRLLNYYEDEDHHRQMGILPENDGNFPGFR
ncbi:MAG: hypothetical protein RIA62_07285, partial [Cyclobacteriaceae bacterium]